VVAGTVGCECSSAPRQAGGVIMAPAKPKTNKTLLQIAKAIKVLEKKTIQNVVEIGKLLCEASEQCDHGEYMPWLKSEFGWSHDTSLNYRNVYVLSQNPNFSDFAKLNISISALYLVARYLKDDDQVSQAAGVAIIEAAKGGRVSYHMAQAIIALHDDQSEPDPPSAESDDEPDSEEPEPDDDLKRPRVVSEPDDDLPEPELDDDSPEPESVDDSPPSAPPFIPDTNDADRIDQKTYARLAEPIHDLIGVMADDPALPAVIEDIGAARLLMIIKVLQAVYDAHCERNEVKSAADRAEAKAKIRLN
jgi:hypothetical protein